MPVPKIQLDSSTLKQLAQLGLRLRSDSVVALGVNLLTPSGTSSESPSWLSVGLPSSGFVNTDCPPIYFCPFGLPAGRSLMFASSRLGRNHSTHQIWFDGFRTLASRLALENKFAVTQLGITADRFTKRASFLFDFDVVEFCRFPKRSNINKLSKYQLHDHHFPCYEIAKAESNQSNDARLIQVAHEIRVLSVRKKGNIEREILKRCERERPNVFVLDSRLTARNLQIRLENNGCHRWLLLSNASKITSRSPPDRANPRISTIKQLSELPDQEFLIHCTRGRRGPWPDQEEEQFIDDLILGDDPFGWNAEATLARILETGKLIATNRLTRSVTKVVCFTDVQWDQLSTLKKFQPHLGRWDFLPIGIAIRKSALLDYGARSVIYGCETTWSSLSEKDQPFFQLRNTTTQSGRIIDWSREREWRTVGDLDLSCFSPNEIFAISEKTQLP